MKKLETIGANYFGHWEHTRTGCRGIVLRGSDILLTHRARNGQYMIPGGGLEPGESEAECCAREVVEETGVLVEPGECVLEIDEYYEDWKYVSYFFLCTPWGRPSAIPRTGSGRGAWSPAGCQSTRPSGNSPATRTTPPPTRCAGGCTCGSTPRSWS